MSVHKTIAIIGGGAAGFFSAINAAQLAKQKGLSLDIRILESSKQYLTKVKISGGGRCNVTHHCFDVDLFCQNYPRGSRELLSPMQQFQARDTVEWFKKAGVRLVSEADGRMFPDTNSSATIVDCYLQLARELKIKLIPDSPVTAIETLPTHQLKLAIRGQESLTADAVLIATGSAPSGYRLAESLGHTITELAPSLFSFKIKDPLIAGLQGLSFPEATLKLTLPGKKGFKQSGPVLITHWGLSGPAILKLSAWAAREMKQANYDGTLTVNWMGAEKPGEVENRLKLLKEDNLKSYLKNSLSREPAQTFLAETIEYNFHRSGQAVVPDFKQGHCKNESRSGGHIAKYLRPKSIQRRICRMRWSGSIRGRL